MALPASVRADAPIRESADVDRYARVHGEGGRWKKRRGMREGTRYAPRYSNNSSLSRSNLLATRVYRCRRETASDASIATSKIQYARPPREIVGSVNPYLSLALSCASPPCHPPSLATPRLLHCICHADATLKLPVSRFLTRFSSACGHAGARLSREDETSLRERVGRSHSRHVLRHANARRVRPVVHARSRTYVSVARQLLVPLPYICTRPPLNRTREQ